MKDLLDSQISAISKLNQFKVGALFMQQGTGKTRIAVELVNSVPGIDRVFWIGPLRSIKPKPGLPSIIDEVNKWGGFNADAFYFGVESISQSDRIYLELTNLISTSANPFIVVDESLKIKNKEAKRTERMLRMSQMCENKLILNGTPISKNLLDLKPQMDFLSPKILSMSDAEFKNTFCEYTTITKSFGGHKRYSREFITGYENIDYLYSLIRHYVFEADLQLLVKQYYNQIFYNLSPEHHSEYKLLKEKYLDNEMLQWKNNNIFLELTQKMQHGYCCTPDKFEKTEQIFKQIEQGKSIIFCKYVASREACEKYFPKATVLSYQKEAMSLNLQHLRYTIYFDKIWDYDLRSHSINRSYRTGQEYDCRYWDLTGDVGLESLNDNNIEKKISMTEFFKDKTKEQKKKVL